MSRSVNKVILVGHAGRDPDMRETSSGKKVAHFTLATNRKRGDDEITDWHRLVAWERTAEFVEDYVTKGQRIYVEGRIEYDSYEKDGVTIPTSEIVVRELVLLSRRDETTEDRPASQAASGGSAKKDSLPF